MVKLPLYVTTPAKTVKHLNKHKLDFSPSWKYAQFVLGNANRLSRELLNIVNFADGCFFTLLPDDANIEMIYEFEIGLILPQNKEEVYFVNEIKSTYSKTPTITNEISDVVFKKVASKNELSCVFDDVLRFADDKSCKDLILSNGVFYENELYYLVQQSSISIDLIKQCLRASGSSFWHSLCVLTGANFGGLKTQMSMEMIREICTKAELILIGAYDGEGYVCWERSENVFG